ncbi:hypothetical protein M4J06_001234 [Streptomyces coelicoflavus]|uniref:hypothetical protein n=1 Tax=Streptomyces coelicoflavus TaxID=285562 RepID=UPI002109A655|nr:hypothetical protein [Streptomyces coelicoflavus]MCQ4203690.1 hypothetical protein [Streptomyces coelicoflavus]
MAAMDVFLDPLDPGMCVVTAAAHGERAGCPVGFSSQCSIRPVPYVVWISDVNRTFRVARSAGGRRGGREKSAGGPLLRLADARTIGPGPPVD